MACVGPGGCEGGQICADDGSRFLECQCNGGMSSGEDAGETEGNGSGSRDASSPDAGPGDADVSFDSGLDPRVVVATEGRPCDRLDYFCLGQDGKIDSFCRFSSTETGRCVRSECISSSTNCVQVGEPCDEVGDCILGLQCFDGVCVGVCGLSGAQAQGCYDIYYYSSAPQIITCTYVGYEDYGLCLSEDGTAPPPP